MSGLFEQMQEHMEDKDNPHSLGKTDVSLGRVTNLPLASESQARQGGKQEKHLTPHRLRLVFDGYLRRNGLMDDDGNPIIASVDAGF